MYCWQVNRRHRKYLVEEVLRIRLETETVEEAVEILENYGYEIAEVDEEFEKIVVY